MNALFKKVVVALLAPTAVWPGSLIPLAIDSPRLDALARHSIDRPAAGV
jgi:hypothetical protein